MYRLILWLHAWSGGWLERYDARRSSTMRMFDCGDVPENDSGSLWRLDESEERHPTWHYVGDEVVSPQGLALCGAYVSESSITSIGYPQGHHELCETCLSFFHLVGIPEVDVKASQRPVGPGVPLNEFIPW